MGGFHILMDPGSNCHLLAKYTRPNGGPQHFAASAWHQTTPALPAVVRCFYQPRSGMDKKEQESPIPLPPTGFLSKVQMIP